jgi:hypothetical protein
MDRKAEEEPINVAGSGKGVLSLSAGPGTPLPYRAGQPVQVWLLNTQPVGLTVLPLAVR